MTVAVVSFEVVVDIGLIVGVDGGSDVVVTVAVVSFEVVVDIGLIVAVVVVVGGSDVVVGGAGVVVQFSTSA